MPTSHKWTYQLSCPKCGADGAVAVVEDSRPPFIDESRRAYTVSGAFALKQGREGSAVCLTCNATFATGQ